MPKVTYKCIDCGKERTAYQSQFKHKREEYRCYKCGNAFKIKNHKSKKVTYACVDCGKERTALPSNFNGRTKENYRCPECAHSKMINDPVWKENSKLANQKMAKDPICIENKKKAALRRVKDPVWINHHSEAMKILSEDPEWLAMRRELNKKIVQDPTWKANNKNANRKLHRDSNWVNSHREGVNKNSRDNPIWKENILIARTGEGFWYGHKILHNGRKHYCELWNNDLKRRIDAAYDYKSILSGKTRFENNGRGLTHHHLYWQEKACCIWDEDINGYYAWILNNGKRVKYYINGDPNKFVLLTDREHGIIKGDKERDRIWWIKHIEGLIEERAKEGKKCYLSPEEYEVYKIEHADIIEKYKK